MSTVQPAVVYRGFWVDHSRDSAVLGATITVTTSTANLLIAFLASLVSLAGLQLWDLIAFFFYLFRVRTTTPAGGFFHQQQVLLRNITSPGALAVQLGKLAWYWRKTDKTAWVKCLLPICLALSASIGFIVAGVFSSQVFQSNNLDILVRSNACGTQGDANYSNNWTRYLYKSYLTLTQYSRTCYGSTISVNSTIDSDPACSVFVQDRIPYLNVSHTSCPFTQGENMCPYAPALILDTGLLDSQSFFGMNSKPSDRLQIRQVTTCAPVRTEGFVVTKPAQEDAENIRTRLGREPLPGENLTLFNYGSFLVDGKPGADPSTHAISSYANMLALQYTTTYSVAYNKTNDAHVNSFNPVRELQVSDADLALLLISGNRVLYEAEVDDPVFAAHTPIKYDLSLGTKQFFIADKPAGVIGCKMQLQYCNPFTKKCTRLTDGVSANEETSELGLNPVQYAMFDLLSSYLVFEDISGAMNTGSLVAAETLSIQQQSVLPPNQWEIEVISMARTSIAMMQGILSNTAIGPQILAPDSNLTVKSPSTPAEEELCRSQKMKAPVGFSNISVFGLGFTIGICSFIIFINQILPGLLLAFWRYRKIQNERVSCWTQDGVLQIQQRALESVDPSVEWQRLEKDIPITSGNRSFRHLSLQPREGRRKNSQVSMSDTFSSDASSPETTRLSVIADDDAKACWSPSLSV